MKNNFDIFVEKWNEETFLKGAFGLEQELDAYLDHPEATNPFEDELNDYLFPVSDDEELIKILREIK